MKNNILAEDTFVDSDGNITDGKYSYGATDDGNAATIDLYDATELSPTLTMPESFMGIPIEEIYCSACETPDGVKNVKRIRFSKSLRVIGYQAFFEFRGLKKISLPNYIDEIGECAFGNCASLETANLGDGVVLIRNDAFSGCKALREVKLPEGLITLDDRAFINCESLEEIKLPRLMNFVGECAFSGCDSLKRIEVDEENWFFSSYAGVLYSNDKSILYRYPPAKDDEIFLMPERVTNVKEGAFEGALNLKKIFISDNLEEMEGDDFTPVSPKSAKQSGTSYLQIGTLYDRIEVYARVQRC